MFDAFRELREFSIMRTLDMLFHQHVERVAQPGNIRVISKALPETEKTAKNIQTCLMRGWVEPLEKAVPKEAAANVNDDDIQKLEGEHKMYRLTGRGQVARYFNVIVLILIVMLFVIILF